MPIIKSAKKRMRQNVKRRALNLPFKTQLKTFTKKALALIQEGKVEEAKKFLPKVYSVIDTAVKKNFIHKNTGARKKSSLAKGLNKLEGKK